MKTSQKSIFFVTLPKSGTVFTWNSICSVTSLEIPEFHKLEGWDLYAQGRDFSCPNLYACGDYNTQMLRPNEMKYFMEGFFFGAHMQASYHNMTVLTEAGIDRIVVLLRDPRDAFISWVYHLNSLGESSRNYHSKIYHIPRDYYNWSLQKQFTFQIRTFFPTIVNRIEGWFDYYASSDRKIDVLFLFYDELKRNPISYIEKIINFNYISNADYSKIPVPEVGKMHYRKGAHDQWKTEFSIEDQSLLNNLMQDRIVNAYKLAAQSHPDVTTFNRCLNSGDIKAAAQAAYTALSQFSNSKYLYDLFFQAIGLAEIDVSHYQTIVDHELSSLDTHDYFKHRDNLVLGCQEILQRLVNDQLKLSAINQ